MNLNVEKGEMIPKVSPLISCVILRNTDFPSADEMVRGLKKRVPEFEPSQPDISPLNGALFMGRVDDMVVSIQLVNTAVSMESNENFIKRAWWWPNAMEDLTPAKAHGIVTLEASEKTVENHALLARLTAAVIEVNKSIGVIWNEADALWQSNYFLGIVNQAISVPPYPLFVSVRLGQDTSYIAEKDQMSWLGMTFGLEAFGIMELEVRGFGADNPELMVDMMQSIASLLMRDKPAIKDGETIEVEGGVIVTIQVMNSTLKPGNRVYRITTG